MTLFIKNFGIIICCIYYYIKLLRININRKIYFSISIFTVLFSSLSIYLDLYLPRLTIPFLIFFLAIFLLFQTRTPLTVTIIATTISFSFSYIIFTFSAKNNKWNPSTYLRKKASCFFQLLSCIFQLILMQIPFLFKRTKKGMPFLYKRIYSIPGMIISLFILFIAIQVNSSNYNIFFIILVVLLQIFAILIYLYWKNNLTKTYIDKLNERNLTDLNNMLAEKLEYIKELEQENKRLSKIIHKDNKLIPAMELAVQSYINNLQEKNTDSTTGSQLLEELGKLSQERKGIIFHQDVRCRKLASTKVMSIDNLLTYMQRKKHWNPILFLMFPYPVISHILLNT